MEQHCLLLAYSIYDILLKKVKSFTQTVESGDEYANILSDVLQAHMNVEVYSKLSIDYKMNVAELLAAKLFSRMYSYEAKYFIGFSENVLKHPGPQYNIELIDGEIVSIVFPEGLFGNKDVLLRELSDVFIEINKYLNFPSQWPSFRNQQDSFFKRLPLELFNMVGSYCMDQDITTLTPK